MVITPETLARWLALAEEVRCKAGPSRVALSALVRELEDARVSALRAEARPSLNTIQAQGAPLKETYGHE